MEEEILNALRKTTFFKKGDIDQSYIVLGKSFDKLLLRINTAIVMDKDIIGLANEMSRFYNTNMKLSFWQKLKKCWAVFF